jgi:hypothetical protein
MLLHRRDDGLRVFAPRKLFLAVEAHRSAILTDWRAKHRWKTDFNNEYGAAQLRIDDDYRRANATVRPRIRRAVEKRRQWMTALLERGDFDTLREVVIDLEDDVYNLVAGCESGASATDAPDSVESSYSIVVHGHRNLTTLVEKIRAALAEANIKQTQFEVTDATGTYVIYREHYDRRN